MCLSDKLSLLKFILALFTDWTDKCVWKFFKWNITVIDISADTTHPFAISEELLEVIEESEEAESTVSVIFRLVSRCIFRTLAFDDIVIVGIGHRCFLIQHITVNDFPKKDCVGICFHFIDDLTDKITACIIDNGNIMLCNKRNIHKLVHISGRLKSKLADDIGVSLFRKYGNCEHSTFSMHSCV